MQTWIYDNHQNLNPRKKKYGKKNMGKKIENIRQRLFKSRSKGEMKIR